ncbi:MAG: bifunctional aspartate kinase/diaminopimelate decarboxylase [Pseudomonadota bacterium]
MSSTSTTSPAAPFPSPQSLGAPADIASSNWVVCKFGGTSVSSRENWMHIVRCLNARHLEGLNTFVVHSAFAGVSDALESIARHPDNAQSQAAHLIELHTEHARTLAVDATLIDQEVGELRALAQRFAEGVAAPAETATLMGLGERMSTRLGCAFLADQGIETIRLDARDWLTTLPGPNASTRSPWLSAVCDDKPDQALQSHIKAHRCVVTQGFIARGPDGEDALLGRGGSDTSAAYFAAKLGAQRLEIWTDVPGMFSADPRIVPSARTLKSLHYDEAQELAAMGSSVLHPHTLTPPARYGIPVFVRSTTQPELEGSCIAAHPPGAHAAVKGIAFRRDLTLISMANPAMWQQAGFLAKAFAVFDAFGVSIDLVSTSESTVTVSLDPLSAAEQRTLEPLVASLRALCKVTVIEDCASVSLVGRNIRTMLHRLAPAMTVFAEHKIHLLSQAANDLNFTVVVDAEQGTRLTHKLHDAIIQQDTEHDTFGQSWERLNQSPAAAPALHWWVTHRDALLNLMQDRDCAFVYHADTIRERVGSMKHLGALDNVLYAMKANPNEQVLETIYEAGMSFECVSPGELKRLFKLFPAIDRQHILYTPNFAPRDDYRFGLNSGVRVTLDNLFPLRHWGEDFRGRDVFVRLDPGHGKGHHELVRTAGAQSKFGIPLFELEELQTLAKQFDVRIKGIHAHSGSGIMESGNWRQVGRVLSAAAARFPEVEIIDLGGGLGIPEKPGDPPLDMVNVDRALTTLREEYSDYRFWMEPGRFIVAEAGALLARVTQTKGKGDVQYVGVATGMNSLIRPALYGAYHPIVNLSRLADTPSERYTVVGPNCETGDRLGLDRALPSCQTGDVLLIANAGAYGYAMSSRYNLREPAQEFLL